MVFTTALRDREWSKFKNINNEPAIRVTSVVDGNPYVVVQDLTAISTDYNIDLNANLTRNAHSGFIKAKSTNAGAIWVKFSNDGSVFTSNWLTDINAGDVMELDGMDIDTLKFQCETAGDDVIVTAW